MTPPKASLVLRQLLYVKTLLRARNDQVSKIPKQILLCTREVVDHHRVVKIQLQAFGSFVRQ